MALVTSTEMFKKAYDGGYAIGAFNVNNMEIVQGITEACRKSRLRSSCRFPRARVPTRTTPIWSSWSRRPSSDCPDIPIALHLDHGARL